MENSELVTKKAQISQYLLSLNTQIQSLQNQLKQAEIDRERAVGGMLMLDELMKEKETKEEK